MTFPGPSLPRSPERYAHKTQAVIQELRQTLRRNGLTIAKQEGLLYFIIFIILMMVIGFGYLAYDINQDLPPEEYEEERDPELDALTFIFLLMALGMVMGPFLTEYFFCLGTSSSSREDHLLLLAPLDLKAIFSLNLVPLIVFQLCWLLLLIFTAGVLAVDNAWELLAILVYSLVWLKLELQFVVWNLSLSVKRHVHQQQDKGPYSLGSSFLLLLVLPFLVVWKTNVLWALCFFLLLLPLDYQAWKLWTKEILPQGGEYRLWQGDQSRRAGMPGATRAEDIPKKEEKKGLLERLSKKEEDIRMKEEGKGWKAVKELYSVLVRRELRLAPAFFFFLYLFFAGIGLILLLVFALDREDFAQFWEELPVALAAAGAFTGVAAVFTVGLETDQYHPANGRGIELFRLIPFTRKELLRGEFWRGVIYFGKMGLLLGAFFLFLGWGEPEAPFGCFLVPVLILVFIGVFGLLGSWRLYSGFGYQEVKR